MPVTVKNVGSGFKRTSLNENFEKLRDEVNNNCLRRGGLDSGEANQMEVNLDMNSKSILNAQTVDTAALTLNGNLVSPTALSVDNAIQYAATLNSLINSTALVVGQVYTITDRGYGVFDVVLASGVTPNGLNIVQCVGVPSLALVLRVVGPVNMVQCGLDNTGTVDVRVSAQTLADLFLANDLFFPSGSYLMTPTSNTNGLTIINGSTSRILGEAGTTFTGDNTLGPLVNYRASANNISINRSTSRGVDSINFTSNWAYVPGVTDVNANTYDFTIGEGTCLAVGNDNIPISNCTFQSTPACILYESSSRTFGGTAPHVYGGQLENYRFTTCMYGAIFYADLSAGGQYVGGIQMSKGFIGDVYKACFASTGSFIESNIEMPVFENVTMLCALMGAPSEITFGNGHYETGWSASSTASQQIAETLDFGDLDADARYSAVRVHTSNVYEYYGYVDFEGTGRTGNITFEYYNKAIYIDRGIMALCHVKDNTNNFSPAGVVDASYVGPTSNLVIVDYDSLKSSGGATVFSQQVRAPFSLDSGQMFQLPHFVNSDKNALNISRSPMCFGSGPQGIDASAYPSDGVLVGSCQEYTIAAGANRQFSYAIGYTNSSTKAAVLYSAAIKLVSTSDAANATLAFDINNKSGATASLAPDGVWRTFGVMVRGGDITSSTPFRILNADTGVQTVTVRVTDLQAVEFDTITELNDYVSNRTFAGGRAQITAANDYIQSINPTDTGVEVVTEYDWSAASTAFNIYDDGHQGQNVGSYFEIEKMECKLISGTGVSLNINDTTSGYWVSAYTPSGTDWEDLTLVNTRPSAATFAAGIIKLAPTVSATMKIQLRTRLRFL